MKNFFYIMILAMFVIVSHTFPQQMEEYQGDPIKLESAFSNMPLDSTLYKEKMHWENPLRQGNTLYGVQAVTTNLVFAVGTAGHILKTTDGGSSWSYLQCAGGRCAPLRDVHFPTQSTGYAVGDDGNIVRTTDTGENWEPMTSGVSDDLYGVSFVSRDTGIAVGSNGIIIRTTDRGEHWFQQTSGTTNTLYDVSFKSTSLAVAVGFDGTILKSINTGITWTPKNSNTSIQLNGVSFYNSSIGKAVGATFKLNPFPQLPTDLFIILATNNGGETWTIDTSAGYGYKSLQAIFGINTSTFYVAGYGSFLYSSKGYIWKTMDGGDNWSVQVSGNFHGLNDISFASTSIGYAVGNYGLILKTTNGGMTWEERSTAVTRKFLRGVAFWDTSKGFAVGDSGTAVKTLNGGDLWTLSSTNVSYTLNDVDMINSTTAIAVGDDGNIIKYSGGPWESKISGTINNLNAVSFRGGPPVSKDSGIAVGNNGTVTTSGDGGNTWSLQSSPTPNNLYGVKRMSMGKGWAVGANGTILRTINGGISWGPQTSGTTSNLYDVEFINDQSGYVVGSDGTILYTENSGWSWTPQTSGTTLTLNSVSFTSPLFGIIVANNGLILSTIDGGITWERDTCVTSNPLSGVIFRNASGHLVGQGGSILHTGYLPDFTCIPPTGGPPNIRTTIVSDIYRPDTGHIVCTNVGSATLSIGSIVMHDSGPGPSWHSIYKETTDLSNSRRSSVAVDSSEWDVWPTSATIQPGDSAEFFVEFTPIIPGRKKAYLIFEHNGLGGPLDTLTWIGYGLDTAKYNYIFGHPPEPYRPNATLSAHHKDLVGTWFVAPSSGTLDTLFFQMGSSIGAKDSVLFITVRKGSIHWNDSGLVGCQNVGYYVNTYDLDNGIAPFLDFATDPTWHQTGSSYPTSPFGDEVWGLGGFPVIVRANQINKVVFSDIGIPLEVLEGDTLFVSMRVNSPSVHINDPPTEFSTSNGLEIRKWWGNLSDYPFNYGTIYPWKFYEHNDGTATCDVDSVMGWREITISGWDAQFTERPSRISLNWWFSMTAVSNTPPRIKSMIRLNSSLSTSPQTVQAEVIDNGIMDAVNLCVEVENKSSWVWIPMANIGGNIWEGTIPGQEPGSIVYYQVRAVDNDEESSVSPTGRYVVIDQRTNYYYTDPANPYVPIDISSTGTDIQPNWFSISTNTPLEDPPTATDDGFYGGYWLGGEFPFFRQMMNYAYINVNGAIVLSPDTVEERGDIDSRGFGCGNLLLIPGVTGPGTSTKQWLFPKNIIAPFYADLVLKDSSGTYGNIYVERDSCLFIVEYDSVKLKDRSPLISKTASQFSEMTILQDTRVSFRVILNLCEGTIEFQYDKVPGIEMFHDVLIGIQGENNAGSSDYWLLINERGYPSQWLPGATTSKDNPQPSLNLSGTSIKIWPVLVTSVCDGWSLLSLGIDPKTLGYSKTFLYPEASSDAFYYINGYQPKDPLLPPDKGFWLKLSGTTTTQVPGALMHSLNIPLDLGWNIIGSISYNIPTVAPYFETNPPGIITSMVFGWNCIQYENVSAIQPGKGYWVKANQPGTLRLMEVGSATAKTSLVADNLSAMNKITIRDASGYKQTLYLDEEGSLKMPPEYYELPPPLPAGVMDARFNTSRIIESYPSLLDSKMKYEYPINIQNAVYPITVEWELKEGTANGFTLIDGQNEIYFKNIIMNIKGSMKISNPKLQKVVVIVNDVIELPKVFAMDQNYPNPFNPITIIKYQLPVDSKVTLKIYNVLGQVVAVLVDEVQEAGYKSVEWGIQKNGIASGTYFYKIDAVGIAEGRNNFTGIKKMILMK